MNDLSQDLTCPVVRDMPRACEYQVPMSLSDGTPVFCGGFNCQNLCYGYLSATNQWGGVGPMLESRTVAGSVKLPNGEYWVMGGEGS